MSADKDKLTAEQQKQLDKVTASLQDVIATKPISDDAKRLIDAVCATMGWCP